MIFLLLYPTTSLSPRSSHTLIFLPIVLVFSVKLSWEPLSRSLHIFLIPKFSVSLASCRFAVVPSPWDLKHGDAASTLQHCEDFINGCVPSLSLCLHGWVPVLFRFLGMQVVGHVLGLIKFLLGQKWIMEEARRWAIFGMEGGRCPLCLCQI